MNIALSDLPIPAIIHKRDGTEVEYNTLFKEILVEHHLELSPSDIKEILPEKYLNQYKDAITSNKSSFKFTWNLGGKNVDFVVKAQEISDASVSENYYLFTFIQTTEILQNAYGQNYDQNLLRTVIDILPSFIYAKDRKSRFIMLNEVLAGYMSGQKPEEIIGKTDFDFFPHKLALKFYCDDQEVINTGRPKIGVVEPSRVNDGKSNLWVSTTKVPLKNDEGEIIGIVGTGTDVTHEKQIKDHLEELENIVNNSLSCAFLIECGEQWNIIYNSNNVSIFGYDSADFKRKESDFIYLIHEDDIERVTKETHETFDKGISDFTHEYRLRTQEGEYKWVEDHKCLRKKTDEGIIIFQSLITDVSPRHQYQEERDSMEIQLRQAQKLEAIGQLAAGISHEINTPIQFISDNLKFLTDSFEDINKYISVIEKSILESCSTECGIVDSVKQKSEELDIDFLTEEIPLAINQSLEGAGRVRDIVKAMKEFSHSGKGEIEAVDVNQTIESTVTVARNEWKYVSDVEMDLDPDLPKVPVDIGPFKQTILNLIVNSAHAIEDRVKAGDFDKGKIHISTKVVKENMLLSVEDTGMGIPDEIVNRIYEPFFTTKEVGKGTGQGLAIAYDIIVRKLKGKLYFETQKGHGTTFNIELPLKTQ